MQRSPPLMAAAQQMRWLGSRPPCWSAILGPSRNFSGRFTPATSTSFGATASYCRTSAAMAVPLRCISLNPLKWGRSDIGRTSHVSLEEELPEIFANQPTEVDDYIRPDRSFFERLEDFWDIVVSFMQPVEKQVEIMRSLRHNGIFSIDIGGWGHVFFFYGLCMRLLTLIPSLYSHRNSLRMAYLSPQISEITTNQNKAKNDRSLSSAEKRVIKDGYNRMKYALCRKHGCSQWKSFLTMLTAPITMSAFLSIRRLSMYETDLEMAPFLWVRDLTMPDPTYALPIICAGMFLLNFELNQRMQRGGRSSSSMYVRWAVRCGSLVGVYFFASQPSAMFAYWIGLSTAGLLQPLLLRWQPFRNFFSFPDPPQAAKMNIMAEIKGPSLYERLFASQEEKLRMEEQRKAERIKQHAARIETVDDYEVVFDDEEERKTAKGTQRK